MTSISFPALAATALIALGALSLSSPASAQASTAPGGPGGPGGPGSSSTPGGPSSHPEPSSSTSSCTDELGYLRRVHPGELAAVADANSVWVMPICVNEDSAFRNAGNVGKLRTAIASNAAMQQALGKNAFAPQEVVGIKMTGPDKVILYVLPLHR